MATRTKILVADSDIDTLSKIYLALSHRNYKAEALDNANEIFERIKHLKPAVIIIGIKEFLLIKDKLKIPAIVMIEKEEEAIKGLGSDIAFIKKPLHLESLIKKVQELTI